MSTLNKQFARLAVAIHAQLLSRRGREPLIELPIEYWQRCSDLVRRVRRAQLRGWQLAANELLRDLRYTIPSIEHELTALLQKLPRPMETDRIVTSGDIYQDLVALKEEFEGLEYDLRTCWLSVVTEPIVLGGIDLGAFEIQLQWDQLARSEAPTYRVVAKDPHPAESRENVTHPHVMDQVLCEGDGRHAIRQALAQGRLLDFFTLIAGILRTYNQESPFVELALWHGSMCSDCGAGMSDDEGYSCQKCGEIVCSDCESLCGGCDDSYCSACMSVCAACDDNYCLPCLATCHGCQARICSGCLNENERCPNCHEKDFPEAGIDPCASPPDGAAVQSHGLGQTPIPARCG